MLLTFSEHFYIVRLQLTTEPKLKYNYYLLF